MAYKSFTIRYDKKNKRYRVDYEREQDGWQGAGTHSELYEIRGVLVEMKFITKPVNVYKDLEEFSNETEKEYGIRPQIINSSK